MKKIPAAVLGIVAALALTLIVSAPPHALSSGNPITGYAWSDNIGWVSLSGAAVSLPTIKTVYLTSGTSWTVPSDWNNSANTIEVIGGGGGGSSAFAGGGGGGYSKISNLALTAGNSVTYTVGSGGSSGAPGGTGGGTYFNGASCGASSVCATGGAGGNGTTHGAGGSASVGSGFSGGSGGDDPNQWANAGGGGAAGPLGAGGNGGTNSSGTRGGGGGGGNGGGSSASATSGANGTAGGNNQSGSGGGTGGTSGTSNGGTASNGGGGGGGYGVCNGVAQGIGSDGSTGTEWDPSHGSGGGGGGAGADCVHGIASGNGGLYGGGGAGTFGGSGNGAQGIIVITYTTAGHVLSGGTYGLLTDNSGNVTGYAWGDNIGWISANPADTASCGAQAKLTSGTFTGWLRALNTGGDGCISLSGPSYQATTGGNSNYSNYSDSAWGSDTVGWLIFNAAGGACTPTFICNSNQLVDTSCGQSPQSCTYGCTNGATSCNNPPPPPPPLTGCISINNASCAAPTKTLRVRSSSTVQLYWNVQNVSTSCTVTGTGGDTESWNNTPVAGVVTNTVTTRAITQMTNFTLSCDSGAFTDQATVNMVPVVKEI